MNLSLIQQNTEKKKLNSNNTIIHTYDCTYSNADKPGRLHINTQLQLMFRYKSCIKKNL